MPVGSIQSEAGFLESSIARRQGGFRSIDWLVVCSIIVVRSRALLTDRAPNTTIPSNRKRSPKTRPHAHTHEGTARCLGAFTYHLLTS